MPELLVLQIRGADAVMVLDVDSKGMFGAAPTPLPEPEPETGASNQSFASFTPKKKWLQLCRTVQNLQNFCLEHKIA